MVHRHFGGTSHPGLQGLPCNEHPRRWRAEDGIIVISDILR